VVSDATRWQAGDAYLKTSANPCADWRMFGEADALGSRVVLPKRERTLMYLSCSVWNWSVPAVSRISSWEGDMNEPGWTSAFCEERKRTE
jgi:hypothetical protein